MQQGKPSVMQGGQGHIMKAELPKHWNSGRSTRSKALPIDPLESLDE